MPNQFAEQLVKDLLEEYWDEQSFSRVVHEVVRRTAREAYFRVTEYSDYRIPASEYGKLLVKHFDV